MPAAQATVAGNRRFTCLSPGLVRMEFAPDGTLFVNGTRIAQLQIVDIPPEMQLQKIGRNTFKPTNPDIPTTPSETTRLEQGMLELSNVDPNQTMVDSISALRGYEASAHILQMEDQTMDRMVNDVGRL